MAGVLIGSRISESKLQLLFGLTIFISAMVLAAYEVTVLLDEIYSVSAYVSTSILLLFYALIALALRERISKA